MPRIFLVGFMGAGKSSVGTRLAARLGYRFVDLDQEISRRLGATIPEVFRRHGEAEFRAAEKAELERCARLDDVVVATGGGAFCAQANREVIERQGGVSVYLDVPWPVLELRLREDHSQRPLYSDGDRARRLFEERLPDYRRASLRVPVGGDEGPDELAARVELSLRGASCAT